MISNVDVQVSFRSTHTSSRGYGGENPLVLVGYDSRVDKFQKVRKMFPHIYPMELHQRVCVSRLF